MVKSVAVAILSIILALFLHTTAGAQDHSSFSFREMEHCTPAPEFTAITSGPARVPVSAPIPATVLRGSASQGGSGQITPASYMKLFPPTYKQTAGATAKNLTIYLVTNANATRDYSVVPLHQAMRQGTARVLETGSVNRLRIANQGTDSIFVHAGDIVKGGRQDRMSRHDVIISPLETADVPAFCVEHGRWSERTGESASQFSASSAGNGFVGSIAVAARLSGNQSAVWSGVGAIQRDLSGRLGSDVTSDVSRTSLELTLGHGAVQAAKLPYFEPLTDLPGRFPNAVGYMAFVDGNFACADVYANNKMFRQMWTKVLSARVTDALISADRYVSPAGVNPYVGETDERQVNARTTQVTDVSDGLVVFKTLDRDAANATVHLNAVRR